MTGQAAVSDHRSPGKPETTRRWSWAFMRKDTYDGPGRKWARNAFLIGKPGNPMMERWRLIQTPLFGVYLHFIHREDLDPVAHDHPWWFASMVLRGGYQERHWDDARMAAGPGEVREFGTVNFYRDGRWSGAVIGRRWHTFPLRGCHRITHVEHGTVTLVLVGRKRRTWGFYDHDGTFVEWDLALGLRPTEGARSTGKYPASAR